MWETFDYVQYSLKTSVSDGKSILDMDHMYLIGHICVISEKKKKPVINVGQ